MQTKALICDEKQNFTLSDVILPEPTSKDILVRALYTGVSIGTEFAIIRGKLNWGPYPLCTGYQGAGVVDWAGSEVEDFKVGDKIYYRDGSKMTLADGSPVSSAAGTHCAYTLMDPKKAHGCAHAPEGINMAVAGMFVMPAVGFFGTDMAGVRMGDFVVVHGVGLIGLGVVAACTARGAVVMAVDIDDKRLAMAKKFGADHLVNSSKQDANVELRSLGKNGADVVFEATGIPELVEPAMQLCRERGKFVWQGNYGSQVSFNFGLPHGKMLEMYFPCNDGLEPCRRAVTKQMAMGTLKWEETITHCVTPEEAPDLYDRINKNNAPDVIGAVIHWSD